jgi:hypothetical protein
MLDINSGRFPIRSLVFWGLALVLAPHIPAWYSFSELYERANF